MNAEMIAMVAATILSGIHGNNGNHTVDTIKNAVSIAAQIADEVEALLKQPSSLLGGLSGVRFGTSL